MILWIPPCCTHVTVTLKNKQPHVVESYLSFPFHERQLWKAWQCILEIQKTTTRGLICHLHVVRLLSLNYCIYRYIASCQLWLHCVHIMTSLMMTHVSDIAWESDSGVWNLWYTRIWLSVKQTSLFSFCLKGKHEYNLTLILGEACASLFWKLNDTFSRAVLECSSWHHLHSVNKY